MRSLRWLRPARLLAAVLPCLLCPAMPAAAQRPPVSSPSADGNPSLLDLTRATIVTPAALSMQERTAVRVLVEEVEKRTSIRLPVASQWPADTVPAIAVGPLTTASNWAAAGLRGAAAAPAPGAEGYRVTVNTAGRAASDGPRPRSRCARRPLRRGKAAPRTADDQRLRARARQLRDRLDTSDRPPWTSARLPPEDELVRRLGRADVGAIHPRPGGLRHQRDRAHAAAHRRCGGQPAFSRFRRCR